MRAWLALFILALVASGCSTRPQTAAPERLPRSSTANQTQSDADPEMREAISRARKELDSFIARLKHPERGEVFSVQSEFPAEDGRMQSLWIGDGPKPLAFANGSFTGYVTTKPTKAMQIHFGDAVTVPKAKITDWMILKSGKSEGGYTVDLLMTRQAQPH